MEPYMRWGRLGRYGPRKPSKISFKPAPAATKLANHIRSAHKGLVDQTCRGCTELQAKVEQEAKGVLHGI